MLIIPPDLLSRTLYWQIVFSFFYSPSSMDLIDYVSEWLLKRYSFHYSVTPLVWCRRRCLSSPGVGEKCCRKREIQRPGIPTMRYMNREYLRGDTGAGNTYEKIPTRRRCRRSFALSCTAGTNYAACTSLRGQRTISLRRGEYLQNDSPNLGSGEALKRSVNG